MLGNKQITTIFITPDDSLLAGSFDGIFRSDDHGMNWKRVLIAGTPLSFARSSGNVLIYGSAGSFVHRSTDNGLTWTAANGIVSSAGFSYLLFANSGDLLAATANYGMLRSSDLGDSWELSNTGLNITDVQSLTINLSGDIFAGTNSGPFRTSDGGETWIWLDSPDFGNNTRFIASNSSGRLFASLGSLMAISDDNGETWFSADSSFDATFPESIAFGSEGVAYVGLYGQIYKSTDNGDTWTEMSTGLPTTSIQGMGVNSDGTVFAGTRHNGVFRLTATGATWEEINNGIGSNFDMTAFVFPPNGDILVAGFDGVFRSIDNGDTWEKMGTVPILGVKDLVRDVNGNLFIAIRGGGVFKTQFIPTSVVQVKGAELKTFSLEQNYPNPFNPSTVINYKLPANSNIKLTVYNTLGQPIRILVNTYQSAGQHETVWDGRNHKGMLMASGLYFYRLETETFRHTRKLMLLR